MKQKYKKRAVKSPTQEEFAEHYSVTQPRIAQLKKLGMPMESFEASDAWMQERRDSIGKGDLAPKTLNELRADKIVVEIRKLELEVAQKEGRMIDIIEAIKIVESVKASAESMAHGWARKLSSMIVGLSEIENYPILESEVDAFIELLNQGQERLRAMSE